MRKLSILVLFASIQLMGQTSIGLFVQPAGQISSLSSPQGQLEDSIFPLLKNDIRLSLGLELAFQVDRTTSVRVRPGYYNQGFKLERSGLKLFDVIHPSLGQVLDQSQAATKVLHMHHRFQQLGIEIAYVKDLGQNYSANQVMFSAGGGLGYYYLLNYDMRLRTEGFAVNGEFTHIIKEQLIFNPREHLVSAFALAEVAYPLTSKFEIAGEGTFRFPLQTLSKGEGNIYVWGPALTAVLRFTPQ